MTNFCELLDFWGYWIQIWLVFIHGSNENRTIQVKKCKTKFFISFIYLSVSLEVFNISFWNLYCINFKYSPKNELLFEVFILSLTKTWIIHESLYNISQLLLESLQCVNMLRVSSCKLSESWYSSNSVALRVKAFFVNGTLSYSLGVIWINASVIYSQKCCWN